MDLLGVLLDVARPLLMILLIVGGGALVLFFGGSAIVFIVTLVVSAPLQWIYRTVLCYPAKKKIEKNFNNGLEELFRRLFSSGVKKIEFTSNSVILINANDRSCCYRYKDLGYESLPNMRYVYAIAEVTNKRIFGRELSLYEMSTKPSGNLVSTGYETTVSGGKFQTKEKTEWVTESSKTYGYELVNYKLMPKKKNVKMKKW